MIYFLFNIFLLISVCFIFFCGSWFFVWIWLECITLCLLVLIRLNNNSTRNLESLSKYFMTQALASIFILIGIVIRFYECGLMSVIGEYSHLSYGLILIGLFIKLGVFPNPYWFVDVINGVLFSRMGYLLVVSKIAPLYLFFSVSSLNFFLLTGLIGVLSALVSSILGINQVNFRKLLSFSSIANLGWFLLCVPIMKKLGVVFCFLGYILTVLPIIWVSSIIKFNTLGKVSRSYFSRSVNFLLVLCLLSLGGLPPFVGFFVKWIFFQSLIDNNLFWLSILLIISSLFSLFFYLYNSFNVYSLFSFSLKNQNLLVACNIQSAVVLVIGLFSVNFVFLFFFVGVFW